MANVSMKELNATINANEQTAKFAAHFSANAAVKNLVGVIGRDDRFKGHGKAIAEGLSGKVGEVVVAKSGLVDHYIAALDAAFKDFTKQNTEWRNSGNTKALGVRVEYLMDKVMEHINKSPEDEKLLGEALANLDNEQEIIDLHKALVADGFEEGSDLLKEIMIDIMLMAAGRTIINEAVVYVEPEKVDGEVVTDDQVEGAAHKKESGKKDDTKTENSDEKKEEYQITVSKLTAGKFEKAEEFNAAMKLLLSQLEGASPDVIESVGNNLKSSITKDMVDDLVTSIDKDIPTEFTAEQKVNIEFHKSVLSAMLPESYKVKFFDMKKVLNILASSLANISTNDLEDADKRDEIMAGYAGVTQLMYILMSPVAGNGADVINFFKFTMKLTDKTEDSDHTKIMTYTILDDIENLPKLMERINKNIETEYTGGFVPGRHMMRGAQERRSKAFIRDGIEVIKKEMKAA